MRNFREKSLFCKFMLRNPLTNLWIRFELCTKGEHHKGKNTVNGREIAGGSNGRRKLHYQFVYNLFNFRFI